MKEQTPQEIKDNVKQNYGAVARGGQKSCCGPSCCGAGDADSQQVSAFLTSYADDPQSVAKKIGYTDADLAALPGEANLGLGCGNPTAMAGLEPGQTVLDLGSGAGMDCFLAAARVGPGGRVIGVDMTADMIAKANENLKQSQFGNIEFRLGEIESLPVDSDSVDVVISNCVLNLVPDKAQAFREIFRVLRPGGRMAVSDIVKLRALPDAIENDPEALSACISGALMERDYLDAIAAAGLEQITVESKEDFGAMFFVTEGPVSDMMRGVFPHGKADGYIASIKVTARRPD